VILKGIRVVPVGRRRPAANHDIGGRPQQLRRRVVAAAKVPEPMTQSPREPEHAMTF